MNCIMFCTLNRLMYWTTGGGGTIWRAEMDGSNSAVLLRGLSSPVGVTIDFGSPRLYWVEHVNHTIKSSDLDGNDIRRTVTLPGNSPWGIATLQDRVYWGTFADNKLHSITKAGEDARTLYDGVNYVTQLVMATSDLPNDRTNHCEYYHCPRICVLTASYARCVNSGL